MSLLNFGVVVLDKTGMYGQGEESTSVTVLKPQEPGLDTNLLITTDRRAYYLRLVSKPQDYTARVAFSYPEEENNQKWQQHLLAQQSQTRDIKRDAQMLPAVMTVETLNFRYKVFTRRVWGNRQVRIAVSTLEPASHTGSTLIPDRRARDTRRIASLFANLRTGVLKPLLCSRSRLPKNAESPLRISVNTTR